MKIFIGGSKTISKIDGVVKDKLMSISEKQYNILVGDCCGIDTTVQEYLKEINYSKVTVYASGNRVRNNAGEFAVRNIPVADGIKGFDFYRKKDIAMANDADCGFMIWDGKSKGTLSNIIDLVNWNKPVEIYFTGSGKTEIIEPSSMNDNEKADFCESSIYKLAGMIYDANKDLMDALR